MITSLNDHCNSIPSSQEPLLNILADRINRSEQNYKRNVTEARARDLSPFKPQTVAEAAVVGLPGSKRRVGTLGSVRF